MARIVDRPCRGYEARRIVSLLLESGLPLDMCLTVLEYSKNIIEAVQQAKYPDIRTTEGDGNASHL